MITSPAQRPNTQSGFTLIELLVALVAGIIVATSVYFIGGASSRHFHEQQRVAHAQTALRTAMMQLRRDIENAGFGGVSSTAAVKTCLPPPIAFSAIDAYEDDELTGTNLMPNRVVNGVSADRLVITGNFMTSDTYSAVGLDAVGASLILNSATQGFRRSFGVPFNPARFAAVFQPGRMLHITGVDGNHFFALIAGTNPGLFLVNLAAAFPVNGGCPSGLLAGAAVAPLARIEWAVRDRANLPTALLDNLAPLDEATANLTGRTETYLIRREVNFAGGAPINNTTRAVLEYVADFNLQFFADTAVGGAPPAILPVTQAQVTAAPQSVISVFTTLSVRTPSQDPRFPFVARAAGAPLTRYQVNDTLPGAARVRSARQEIYIPNVAEARSL